MARTDMRPTRRRRARGRGWRHALPPLITIASLIAIWQIVVQIGQVSPRVLASPGQVAASMIETWPELLEAASVTAYESLTGFAIAIPTGMLIGVGLHVSKLLHRSMYPLLVGAQTIPLIAIAPLFMLWFGFEPVGKIVLVAVFSLFPIAVQTSRGLQAVPRFYEDVALTCGATRGWTLWHVKMRVAARQIFGGIRIAAAYVFGTAVTAEYLGAMGGFGIWLQGAFNSFRTAPIFSATIIIVAQTGLLMALVGLAERMLLGPEDDATGFDGGGA